MVTKLRSLRWCGAPSGIDAIMGGCQNRQDAFFEKQPACTIVMEAPPPPTTGPACLKRRSTEPRNSVTMGVAATQDATFDRRELGVAQVIQRRQ